LGLRSRTHLAPHRHFHHPFDKFPQGKEADVPHQDESDQELHELLTVDDVAALLKVNRSWVYEHTRAQMPRADRLPFIKMGKDVRSGNPLGPPPWRIVRAPVEASRRAVATALGSGGGVRRRIRYTQDGGGGAADPALNNSARADPGVEGAQEER
jgi:hypothetical protein